MDEKENHTLPGGNHPALLWRRRNENLI